MFAKIKEAASHTLIYGLGSVAQTLLGVLLIPLYTHAFTPAEYGTFTLITLAGTLAAAFFYFGAPSALARSYYDHPEGELRRRTVTTALAIVVTGSLVQMVLGAIAAPSLSVLISGTTQFSPHVRVSLAASALASIIGVCLVVLRCERRSVMVVAVNVIALVLTAGLTFYLLLIRHEGIMAPLVAALVSQTVVCMVLLVGIRRSVASRWLREEIPLQLRYGLGALAIGLAYYALDSVDRVLLAHFTSAADVGIYSLGYKVGMSIHVLFILPFSQIWTPMRLEYRHDRDADELFKVMLTYYWLVGLLATVSVSIFARELIHLVARSSYGDAWRVVPIVMLAHLVYGSVGLLDSGIIFSRRLSYHVYIFTVGFVVNVLFNVLLIPRFGYMAAAWVTLGSYVAVASAVFVVSSRLHPIRLESRQVLLFASAALALWAGVRIDAGEETLTAAIKVLVLLSLAAFWYYTILNSRERHRLLSVAGRP
jgi:O-antigen/teichoic acid export membrane protein